MRRTHECLEGTTSARIFGEHESLKDLPECTSTTDSKNIKYLYRNLILPNLLLKDNNLFKILKTLNNNVEINN